VACYKNSFTFFFYTFWAVLEFQRKLCGHSSLNCLTEYQHRPLFVLQQWWIHSTANPPPPTHPGKAIFKNNFHFAELEDLRVVVMSSAIYRNIALCSRLNCNRRFGGTYRLQLQCPELSKSHKGARYQDIMTD
jgi:hypothetical protein